MNYIITYPSALEFWMHQPALQGEKINLNINTESIPDKDYFFKKTKYMHLTKPVHLELTDGKRCRNTPHFVFHSIKKGIPDDGYIRLSDNIFISSPELCFLQAAVHLKLPELVELANELCSAYFYNEYADYGLSRRTPITSVFKIHRFLKKVKSAYGINNALKAISYASDNAFSPFESKIAAILKIPVFLGGYGVSGFKLNYKIKLSAESKILMKRSFLTCDLVWPDKKVVFEYDSNMTHLTVNQHSYDKKRITVLNSSGYQVITATADQFEFFSNMEDLFMLLRKKLGYRPYKNQFLAHTEIRHEAFKQLFCS